MSTCFLSICSHSVAPTAGLPGGPLWLRMSTCLHSICSHSVAPTVRLSGGLLQLPRRRSIHPICSRSGEPTAGLPGGLLQLPWRRCPHPNCSHSVAPTAGLPGGRLWLRLSTCPGSNGSQFGAAIAATRGALQQLLQHSTFVPMYVFSTSRAMHPCPMPGHARSDQLAARPLAVPAGLPEQQLGGACREATVKTYLQALWHPATS